MKNLFKVFFILISIMYFTAHSLEVSSSSELKIDNLKVIRSEMPDVFESVLVLANDDMTAKVVITCNDGSGPLQSVISASYLNNLNNVVTRVFSGSDFYCYGAGSDLAAKLKKGLNVQLLIQLDNSSPRKVTSVKVSSMDGNGINIVSNRQSTNWIER